MVKNREVSKPVVNSTRKTYNLSYGIEDDGVLWEKLYRNIYKTSICTRYRSFQFRSLHNLIYGNKRLHLFKIKSDPVCNFCKKEVQTSRHLLIDCPSTMRLWSDVGDFFDLKLNVQQKIVGDTDDMDIALISLITRVFIYDHNLNNKTMHIGNLIRKISNVEQTEKTIAENSENMNKIYYHLRKWMNILNIINNPTVQ